MADYYALASADSGSQVTIAFHYDLSGDTWTNAAGLTLAQCLGQDPGHVGISEVPWLDQATRDEITAGTRIEIVAKVNVPRDASAAVKQAIVEKALKSRQESTAVTLRRRYWAFGYEGTVGG